MKYVKPLCIVIFFLINTSHHSYCMNTKNALTQFNNTVLINNQNDDKTSLLQLQFNQVEFGPQSKQFDLFGNLLILCTPGTMKYHMAKDSKKGCTRLTIFDPHAIQLRNYQSTIKNKIHISVAHNDRISLHKITEQTNCHYNTRAIYKNKELVAYLYYNKTPSLKNNDTPGLT